MIELRDVFLALGEPGSDTQPILRGLSLSVPDGQFVTIIGANGSGKSTLLNVIAGRFKPDRGQVLLAGKDVTREREHQRARRVARVFQNPSQGTCPTMTVEENMRLAELRGKARGLAVGLDSSARRRFADLLVSCGMGLEDRLGQNAGSLSGGQRQALSLVLATLVRPDVLLLDEHTAALDPRAAESVARLTQSLVRDQRLTTLMVTHSMAQALDLGDRTLVVHQGRVAWDLQGAERTSETPESLVSRLGQLYASEIHSKI
jgi:putative tryptophan/tyrosine transport system ATP-binding protein